MTLTPLDHVLAATVALVLPLWGLLADTPGRRSRLVSQSAARAGVMWETMGVQWTLAAIVVSAWWTLGRPWETAGLGTEFGWLAGALLLVMAIGLAVLTKLQMSALQTAEDGKLVVTELQRIAPFLPQHRRELGPFAALSATAGICEELLFRGFLVWYVAMWLAEGSEVTFRALAWGVVVTSMAFSAGHAYQGMSGVIKTFVAGLVFGGVYLATGSIWLSMLLHALLDLNGGFVAVRSHELARLGPPEEATDASD